MKAEYTFHRGHAPPCRGMRRPDAEKRFNEQFTDHPLGDFHTFAGFDQVLEWEREFMGESELAKYEGTVGHQPAAE